ncbi:MAG: hypothetical protein MUF64_04920 [Polyangiaceae bacterium]|jgi:tellurite resistance protein|nr:hypothetical protein [Polyangiaceae bacterium]
MPSSNLALFLIAALGLVAWADGVLMPGEARFFLQVIDGLQLPPDERAAALRSVIVPVAGVQELPAAELSAADQRQVLRFAYAMASADGAISDAELGVIRELGQRFGVSWAETIEIIGHPIAW